MHEFGKGRPDIEDEKDLKGFVKKIKAVLNENCEEKVVQVPGNNPYKEWNCRRHSSGYLCISLLHLRGNPARRKQQLPDNVPGN